MDKELKIFKTFNAKSINYTLSENQKILFISDLRYKTDKRK